MAGLSLYFLGSPRIELDGKPVDLTRRKAVALLAYLAVTGQEHSRDALAALFWPDSEQSRARGALRRTLSVLNTNLGNQWLDTHRDTIALNTPETTVDVVQFRQELETVAAHNHAAPNLLCTDCVATLSRAVERYENHFLAGFTLRDSPAFDDWQFFETENLRRNLAEALEKLARYHAAQQAYQPAITYARRWVEQDGLHEPAHQMLMQLYTWTDQRSAALRQYQECARILEEELDELPSKETTQLYEQIRSGNLKQVPEPARARQIQNIEAAFSPEEIPLPSFLSTPPPQTAPIAPFVAREEELSKMDTFLQAALAGHGKVLFVTGEAGSGKTALVQEFTQQAQQTTPGLVVAGGNCNAHTGPGDPYLPFREILSLLTGDVELKWNQGLITQENINRLWHLIPTSVQKLVEFGPDLIDVFVPNAALVTRAEKLFPGLGGAVKLDQHQKRGNGVAQSDLFEQFTHVIQALAQQQPLILVMDDAQWADAASINLLFHLGRQLGGNKILMIVTYRSDDVALGRGGERHPLEAVVNELRRIHGNIQLDLDQAAGRSFVDAVLDTRENLLGDAFRTALHHHTQGHPLFTLELLWGMYQRDDLVQDEKGRWIEGPNLNWAEMPARVEAVIKERLDRLDDHLREVLTMASIEGERFTAQIVANLQNINERQLLRELSQELEKRHRLIRSHGELEVNGHYLSRYRFTHTLFQQYLYNSLSAGERRLLHRDIAQTLETLYAGQTQKITVRLARHYAEAGEAEKAVDYLLQAGDRARNLYDNRAAADHYQKALKFLKAQGNYAQAAQTLMKLGLTYHLDFEFEKARAVYDEGFSLWQQAGASQPTPLPPAQQPLRLLGYQPATLDPTVSMDESSVTVINKLFSGLVKLRPGMEVVPDLAQRWEVVDGCKYVFHLREDAFWSDGVPVTAGDVAYAWKRVLTPAINSLNAPMLYDIKNAKAFHNGELTDPDEMGIYAQDATTLVVELESPTSYFPHLLTHTPTFPIPRHIVEKYGEAWTQIENLVTNGPFKIERYDPGQSMIFERNPTYHGQFTGNVRQVVVQIEPDNEKQLEKRLKLYQNDEVDILELWYTTAPEMARIQRQFCDEYRSVPLFGTKYVGFDLTRPPFDDARVRRAFVMAIDKKTVADVAMGGYVYPATGGFVPPGMPGHSPGIGLPFDPEQARRLLAEAGYPDGQGFPEIEWVINHAGQAIEYLQNQWRDILNINLGWILMPQDKAYFYRIAQHTPHLFCLGWSADYPDPDNFLRASCISSLIEWTNETFDVLIEQARLTTDQAERIKLFQQADKILVEEAPIIPYFYFSSHFLMKPWVTGYPTSPIRPYFWEDTIIEAHD